MHISVELSYLLYLQNQCTVRKRKRKQGDTWIHAHQSRSIAYTSGRVPHSLFKTAFKTVVLDVPALQHAACGGVMVMVQLLRLAEVYWHVPMCTGVESGYCIVVFVYLYTYSIIYCLLIIFVHSSLKVKTTGWCRG